MTLRIQNTPRAMTVAGTEIQYLEIYTRENYLFPVQFRQGVTPINANGWTTSVSTTYYTGDYTGTDPSSTQTSVTMTNLVKLDPQPNTAPWIGNIFAAANANAGQFTLRVPAEITPADYVFQPEDNPVLLAVLSLNVTREDATVSREPIGFVIRDF